MPTESPITPPVISVNIDVSAGPKAATFCGAA